MCSYCCTTLNTKLGMTKWNIFTFFCDSHGSLISCYLIFHPFVLSRQPHQYFLYLFLTIFQLFWVAGSAFSAIMAYFVMPVMGWRWLLVYSAVPLVLFCVACLVSHTSYFHAIVFMQLFPHAQLFAYNAEACVYMSSRNLHDAWY